MTLSLEFGDVDSRLGIGFIICCVRDGKKAELLSD